ncbi:MAG: exo-alpha-sialidase [Candidatus Brocadiia bacterium]|nr:exo-alpha-sialidase [Candidatus Brocadiia bacterium]
MESCRSLLRIGDGRDWRFAGGDWADGEGGLLSVREEQSRAESDGMQGMHFAFARNLSFQDCTVRFEFRLLGHTDAGIILRAQDESHFDLVHFPTCGQAARAQNFWVVLSKMDGSGYLRQVKMEMMRRVPSTKGVWLRAEVNIVGRRIIVRVGDHGRFEAEDDTYAAPGHPGVFLCSPYPPGAQIRNVVVEGAPAPIPPWHEAVRQPTNWAHPVPTAGKIWQCPLGMVRFPDGELLLNYEAHSEKARAERARATSYAVRSLDAGRTWSEPEEVSWNRPHLTPAGRLIRLFESGESWVTAESPDRGHTWFDPAPTNLPTAMPGLTSFHPGPLFNLADGAMLAFGGGRHELNDAALNVWTWGALHCQKFAFRSEDDGRTWSEAVNVDTPGFDAEGKALDGNLDLTELSPMQLSDGRIMVLIRPIYSPWMWETWSHDGGRTWGPCVRGPFPGYATPNVVRTACGALLIAHRLPWLTVHCSLDEGRTWQGTIIDSGTWAMGAMREVEPNVVFYVYWDSFELSMRAQYLRVTPSGLEPVRR